VRTAKFSARTFAAGVIAVLSASTVLATLPSEVGATASYDTANPYGNQVAVSGRRAVLGVPSYGSSRGIVYQYLLGNSWKLMTRITANGGGPGDSFGAAVAYTGNGLIVGAPGRNQDNGAVYTIVHVSGLWGQSGSLVDPSEGDQSRFGTSVAVGGGRVVIGAPGLSIPGVVYVARTVSGSLQITGSMAPATTDAQDKFGQAVALQNGAVLVGAPGTDNGAGAAYLFKIVHGAWTQVRKFTETSPQLGDHFGTSVAFTDSGVAIGAPDRTVSGHPHAGAVDVFETQTSVAPTELHAATPTTSAFFGRSISASGVALVIGAPGTDLVAGSALVATHGNKAWTLSTPVVGNPGERLGWSVGVSTQLVPGPRHTHLKRIIPLAANKQFLGILGR
jgi:hypothetical protein